MKLFRQNPSHFQHLPSLNLLKRILKLVFIHPEISVNHKDPTLTIRFVGVKEGIELNRQYRQINQPTNVLSFQDKENSEYLGDVVICVPIVRQEANIQAKKVDDHFTHLVIHGILHLLGFDHQTPLETQHMEDIEDDIWNKLNS